MNLKKILSGFILIGQDFYKKTAQGTGATLRELADMLRQYKICGLTVECDFSYPTMTARAEKYITENSGKPDISVFCQESYDEFLSQNNPALTEDEREVIGTAGSFYMQLVTHGGFLLHASAVEVDGRAYLFSALSGTGKSTHTEQWLKLFGERARIINDDKPAICVAGGNIIVYGTPWSGKSDLNINVGVPLQGICMLERSRENFIEPLPADKAVFGILNQTVRPPSESGMDCLLSMLDEVISCIPIWRMGCNISTAAAQTAYEAMSAAHG